MKIENLRYKKKSSTVITIDLQNGYSITAMETFNPKHSTLHLTLYIKDNTVDILDLMEEFENIEIEYRKSTNISALKYIATEFSHGKFDKYIERYNYIMKCIDRGNALFEEESFAMADILTNEQRNI